MIADPASIIHDLECTERIRGAPIQLAIDSLQLQSGAQVLDLGCGIGLQARQLAAASYPQALARFCLEGTPSTRDCLWAWLFTEILRVLVRALGPGKHPGPGAGAESDRTLGQICRPML